MVWSGLSVSLSSCKHCTDLYIALSILGQLTLSLMAGQILVTSSSYQCVLSDFSSEKVHLYTEHPLY